MPRNHRAARGGYCYHALNRGNARRTLFHQDGDYAAFVQLLREARERTPVRLLAWCLMPNHFYLALWPSADGDLNAYRMRLLTAQVRRYHHYHGSGHVYQGRFRPFPLQVDGHLLTVLRSLERNPVRAGLVDRASDGPWITRAMLMIGAAIIRTNLYPGHGVCILRGGRGRPHPKRHRPGSPDVEPEACLRSS